MARWGMVIDLDKCTGCQACVVACKVENNVSCVEIEEGRKGRIIQWIYISVVVEEASYPHTKVKYIPILCQHCDSPPCTNVCPTGATYKNNEGIVAQIYPRCIGCRYCANACPYSIKFFSWYSPNWTEDQKRKLNPDVSIRPKGVIEKCTFCHHRLIRAKENAKTQGKQFVPEDYIPACVETCPAGAMVFGDLDDHTSEVSQLAMGTRAFKLMEELGTEPKVIYLSEGAE